MFNFSPPISRTLSLPLATYRYYVYSYWKLDASAYTYPKISVPWDPADAIDPNLQRIRDERGYSYADIITVHPDTLPEYDTKVKAFFEEHIHDPRKFGTS